ncbi:hypothetical protein B296_00005662 [Ensete ventricosum]|uniref:Glucosamine inositolphosphorylceramide transferase 1 n=1 Tax=Ensete ventricosum TaxID=4639 RepID=A0A427AVJ4_ENSVE|nr:hypothetical protein B296_00005662 [Ensete ventricosum]
MCYTKLVDGANDSGLSLLPVTATGSSRKEKTTKKKEMSTGRRWRSDTFLFLASAAVLLGSTAALFAWLTFSPFPKPLLPSSVGCRPDGEGSWSVGLFYGSSPLSLQPIESWNVWSNGTAAWPVANPVVTCASASDAGFPSNFVADPFLFIQIYMMPEGSKKGDLRLYRAVEFPLRWQLEMVILRKPLVDSFIINHRSHFWLFGSDFSAPGAKKNGELEIWHSSSPLGPWSPHQQNPVHNMDKSLGARNAGRPFTYDGELYRPGQDCGDTYGRRVRLFKVKVLTKDEYEEVEVPLGIDEPRKGRNAWNGARYHHLDVQQLTTDQWVAVMDGDRVPSGDAVRRLVIGYASFGAAIALVMLSGVLLSAIKCNLRLSRCLPLSTRRSGLIGAQRHHPQLHHSKLGWLFSHLSKMTSHFGSGGIRPNTCTGRSVLALFFLAVVTLTCVGTYYVYGGNGAEEAYQLKGHYSQFTLLTMTYDARLWNLKTYVKHYSRCASVREILVVWNRGQPPNVSEFDSTVPVRIRVEKRNSLNNRFNVDPSIQTLAVLELDDDIIMPCDDVERGFKVWRDHPESIVGFYPRLAEGRPLRYRDEKYAQRRRGYNMILTGAAFMDHKVAFGRYWSQEARIGRKIVDEYFNCEDVLMNFLYANASSSRKTVEYVKASWAVDTSKFSGVAISRNTQAHYEVRSDCLAKFTEVYGDLAANKWRFGSRKDGWDV